MTESERVYSTKHDKLPLIPTADAELDAQVKKITLGDNDKLSIALECQVDDVDTLEQVKNLTAMKIAALGGPIKVLFSPIQGNLDL